MAKTDYIYPEEGKGLASIEDSVDASIWRLEEEQRKIIYSDQKQYRQHKDKQKKQ